MTEERITEIARRSGIPENRIFCRELLYQHRCRDSEHFLSLVDALMDNPQGGLSNVEPFSPDEKYKVALVREPQALFALIREKNNAPDREKGSRVLAGKGRSFGRDWSWWMNDNDAADTVGPFRNYNGKFRWNKRNYVRPDTFASDAGSVGTVGCLDTSQGLDFDYVGVIIAPDLIYDTASGRVEVRVEGHQQEDPNTGLRNRTVDLDDVKEIIRNTYRVLFTRGVKGCFIYCCDENLQNYLETVLPVLDVAAEPVQNNAPRANGGEVLRRIIGNKNNNTYHTPECRYAPRNPQKIVEFASVAEAAAAGYLPCWTCRPQAEDNR